MKSRSPLSMADPHQIPTGDDAQNADFFSKGKAREYLSQKDTCSRLMTERGAMAAKQAWTWVSKAYMAFAWSTTDAKYHSLQNKRLFAEMTARTRTQHSCLSVRLASQSPETSLPECTTHTPAWCQNLLADRRSLVKPASSWVHHHTSWGSR